MAHNKELKKKAEDIASEVFNVERRKNQIEKTKLSTKRDQKKEKDVWKRLQLNSQK